MMILSWFLLCVIHLSSAVEPSYAPTAFMPSDMPTKMPTTVLGTSSPTKCMKREEPIDVYFLIDGSGSINDGEWDLLLNFLWELMKEAIDVEGDRIGVVQFSAKPPVVHFTFDDSRDLVEWQIRNIDQLKGGTKTADGVQAVIDSWKTEKDLQDGRAKLMVLITDGVPNPASNNPCVPPNNQMDYLEDVLKVETVILGIGVTFTDTVSQLSVLNCMVKDMDQNMVLIDDFTDFSDWRDPTDDGLLCVPDNFLPLITFAPTTSPTKCVPRVDPIDLYFLIDGSKSITKPNWAKLLDFVKKLTRYGLNIEGDRVGVVQFGGRPPITHFTFADGTATILDNVLDIEQIKGGSKTDRGIQEVLKSWGSEADPQDDRNRIMVLITDGVPNPEENNPCGEGHTEHTDLLDMGIETVIVGIDMSPSDVSILGCLVNDLAQNTVSIDDFDDFSNWRDPTENGDLCVPDDIFVKLDSFAPTRAPVSPPTDPTESPTRNPDCPEVCGNRGKVKGSSVKSFDNVPNECDCRDRCGIVSLEVAHWRYNTKRKKCTCYEDAKVTVQSDIVGSF